MSEDVADCNLISLIPLEGEKLQRYFIDEVARDT